MPFHKDKINFDAQQDHIMEDLITSRHQLELRHIRYFLAVATDLHYRKAADRLYISQPGLSRQIKNMEETLGLQLFERHNRKVNLTPAGEYLKGELTKHIHRLDHIIDAARLIQDGTKGRLTMAYVGSAMYQLIPKLLVQFKRKYPEVVVGLQEMDNLQQIEGIANLSVDIGFVRSDHVPKGLKHQVLLEEHFCLVLPKDHWLTTHKFQSLLQLKDEPFIMFEPSYSPTYHGMVMQIFDDAGFQPNISHNTIHGSSIFKLVEHQLGISIVPKSLLTDHGDRIKFIELKDIPQRTTLSILWNPENTNPILPTVLQLCSSNQYKIQSS